MPSRCAVCERPAGNLCSNCEAEIGFAPQQIRHPELFGIALCSYDERISRLLVSFKDQGQFGLASDMARQLKLGLVDLPEFSESIAVVPIPSRIENFRRRGYSPTLLLAQQLASRDSRLEVVNGLSFQRRVSDQVGLSAIERRQNLSGSMKAGQQLAGRLCLVLDDTVTTGASMREALRALSTVGATVVRALCFSQSARG